MAVRGTAANLITAGFIDETYPRPESRTRLTRRSVLSREPGWSPKAWRRAVVRPPSISDSKGRQQKLPRQLSAHRT